MKNTKKLISVLCAMCMVFAISCTAFASDGTENEALPFDARVVGTQFFPGSDWNSKDLDVGSDVAKIKLWVSCDTGSMDVYVTDDNNKTVGKSYTLISGSDDPDHIYHIVRSDSYTGSYTLHFRGTNGYDASGWYNWVSE